MASNSLEAQERSRLYKFTKILTLKIAQIVVQSRQGKKIAYEFDATKPPENGMASSPTNLQWFNLSIPDEPDVDCDTKHILNGEVVEALANVLCIEISLKTTEGDEMVLEIWTVKMIPECDMSNNSISTIYYRMSIMLKSTLSISRVTPAYKISRAQHGENYKIFHKIYGGFPSTDLLGDNYKTIKVSELHTPIGTILIEVLHRTKMTIIPNERQKYLDYEPKRGDIMVKSDHFPVESPRKGYGDKKPIDLTKPLTAGAFVDVSNIKELHDTLSLQLPPEPPMSWLLSEKERLDNDFQHLATEEIDKNKTEAIESNKATNGRPHMAPSKAIEVPAKKEDKYSSLMEFPFADGSPITELANFYQECLHARSICDEWTDVANEVSTSTDSETLSQQLKMYEEAIPEFDSMIASMFSNSENNSNS